MNKKKLDFFPFTLNIFKKLREEWAKYLINALKYLMTKTKLCLSMHTKSKCIIDAFGYMCKERTRLYLFYSLKGFDGENFVINVDWMGSDLFCCSISHLNNQVLLQCFLIENNIGNYSPLVSGLVFLATATNTVTLHPWGLLLSSCFTGGCSWLASWTHECKHSL